MGLYERRRCGVVSERSELQVSNVAGEVSMVDGWTRYFKIPTHVNNGAITGIQSRDTSFRAEPPPNFALNARMGIPESFQVHIFDNIVRSFAVGAVGGSAFHFLKGIHSSPKGARLVGGSQAVRMNAPRIGGSFAVWAGLKK
ncbi:hypothetical protein CASFOL_032879 [Castilleja foliolosa]|uniref:Ribosomal protein L5 n=1 Tax=Castilleja foliolosa TaxID=1961234 RepID=A0ABD3C3M0_9LAMI